MEGTGSHAGWGEATGGCHRRHGVGRKRRWSPLGRQTAGGEQKTALLLGAAACSREMFQVRSVF